MKKIMTFLFIVGGLVSIEWVYNDSNYNHSLHVSEDFQAFLDLMPNKPPPYSISFSDLNFKPEGYLNIDYKYLKNGMIPLLKYRRNYYLPNQELVKKEQEQRLISKYLRSSMALRIIPYREPIQYFKTKEGFFAVIYSNSYWNNWNGRIECKIFDRGGKEKYHMEIASSQNNAVTVISAFNSDFILKKESYENEWEKDLKESYKDGTFDKNRITNRKLKTTEFYKINRFGEFEFIKKVESKKV